MSDPNPLPREQAAAQILEDAGIVTLPDGSEREPTPEPHPFDQDPASIDEGEAGDAQDQGDLDLEHDEDPAPGTQLEDHDDEDPGDEPGDEDPDGQAPEQDLAALAESMDTSVEELYELKIPLGGEGGDFTLGEIKDRVQDLRTLDIDRDSLELDRSDNENQKLVARQELQTVVAMLGDSISPQLLQHAREQLNDEIVRERDLTFEAIPEWNDQETAQRERKAINGFLREYGFSAAELSQVYDHRLLKLARDAQQNKARIRTAAESAHPVRKLPGRPAKRQGVNAQKRKRTKMIESAAQGGPDQKLAGVSALLTGD